MTCMTVSTFFFSGVIIPQNIICDVGWKIRISHLHSTLKIENTLFFTPPQRVGTQESPYQWEEDAQAGRRKAHKSGKRKATKWKDSPHPWQEEHTKQIDSPHKRKEEPTHVMTPLCNTISTISVKKWWKRNYFPCLSIFST